MFDVVIINDDLERAYEELKEILDEVRDTGRFTPGRVNQRVTNPPASKRLLPLLFFRKSKKFRKPNHKRASWLGWRLQRRTHVCVPFRPRELLLARWWSTPTSEGQSGTLVLTQGRVSFVLD